MSYDRKNIASIYETILTEVTSSKQNIDRYRRAYSDASLLSDDEIKDIINSFNDVVDKLKFKDLFKYQSSEQVKKTIESAESMPSKRQAKKVSKEDGAIKIYQNDLCKVYHIIEQEAACLYGAGTKWCTASKTDNAFNDYSENGSSLYYILRNDGSKDALTTFFGSNGALRGNGFDSGDNKKPLAYILAKNNLDGNIFHLKSEVLLDNKRFYVVCVNNDNSYGALYLPSNESAELSSREAQFVATLEKARNSSWEGSEILFNEKGTTIGRKDVNDDRYLLGVGMPSGTYIFNISHGKIINLLPSTGNINDVYIAAVDNGITDPAFADILGENLPQQ